MKASRWISILLIVVAFLIPVGVRFGSFYRGIYRSPEIAMVDPAKISFPETKHIPYVDQPAKGEGRVVFDISKSNNLGLDDLSVLQDRLAARGVKVVSYDGTDLSLVEALRSATAFVVAVPTLNYTAEEVDLVRSFVEDGGRLLILADPTRPVPVVDEFDITAIFFSISAAPAANSVANSFGITYFTDYLYNITDNVGNYRNVSFSPGTAAGALGEGVNDVVFFAAHSLQSEGETILTGDDNTKSNVRVGETGLAAAVTSADGKVLALGDITFMTPPFNTQGDNDRFLSNLADWLAQDDRSWSLEEFPYLFQQQVDVVQTFAEALAPGLIAAASPLQETITQAGQQAGLRQEAEDGHDVIYLATFDKLDTVQDFLDTAKVTIQPPQEEEQDSATDKAGDEAAEPDLGEIQVEGFGNFVATGSSLFLVNQDEGQTSLVVVAEDEDALGLALNRLSAADFSNCASYGTLKVCSNDESTSFGGEQGGGETTTDGSGQAEKVFILSADNGQGILTTAYDMESILKDAGYQVTVWSQFTNGLPDTDQLQGYDVYVVDSGDFAWDTSIEEAVGLILSQEGSILITGEQPFQTDSTATLVDLMVADGTHPLASGFQQGEVINLYDSANMIPSSVMTDTGSSTVVFTRGPASEQADSPVVIAQEDGVNRFVLATFALYRLPEDALNTMVLNLIDWLTWKT